MKNYLGLTQNLKPLKFVAQISSLHFAGAPYFILIEADSQDEAESRAAQYADGFFYEEELDAFVEAYGVGSEEGDSFGNVDSVVTEEEYAEMNPGYTTYRDSRYSTKEWFDAKI